MITLSFSLPKCTWHALLLISLFFFTCCNSGQNKKETQQTSKTPLALAPEINTSYGWLNADKSYNLKDFKGKIVLLDFWTYGCINCQHIIPDLEKLEKEYANELVVIGVHSAKFASEKLNQNIQKAILKFGIEHPVVNDADYKVWKSYQIQAWPTVVLINPDGEMVAKHAGEGFYPNIKKQIDLIIKEQGDKIDKKRIAFQLEKDKEKQSILKFPSKLFKDEKGNLYIADSGNNRILYINQDGKILAIIGNGQKGLKDGNFEEANFYEPHGLAKKGDYLYVADTKNNAIRKVDLIQRKVTTIAGDGKMGSYKANEQWDVPIKPNSPWDVWIVANEMYVANAGNHQILKMDLTTEKLYRFAGTGKEALTDGNLKDCAFNQPSGITQINNKLYIADAEASAIRCLDLSTQKVSTLVGKGLFEFGDVDGELDKVLLQHCVGITAKNKDIFIADTYNGKVKKFDVEKGRINTVVASLDEPNAILFIENNMWISDTNNNRLVKVNLQTNEKQIVKITE